MSTAAEIQPVAVSSSEHEDGSPPVTKGSSSRPAVISTVSSPTDQSRASSKTAKRASGPPPGYKLIKRRKEDGTFITIARKMTPEELETTLPKKPAITPDFATSDIDSRNQEGIAYNIITVRDSDGALIRVKRPIKAGYQTCTPSSPAGTTRGVAMASTDRQEEPAQSQSIPNSELKSPEMSAFVSVIASEAAQAADSAGSVTKEKPIDTEAALLQQKETHRQKRMQKFRGSLIRGFGAILGSSTGHLDLNMDDNFQHSHELAGDIEDGDIIDSDQSWSDDDDDDNDDGENGVGDEHDHGDDEIGEFTHGELNFDLSSRRLEL